MDSEDCKYERGPYTVDTSRDRLDLDVVHGYLSQSYWCPGLPRDVLEKAVAHSLCFGLYEDGQQIGFARVMTDYARFAHLCDVFVLESHRGRGLGKWLVECVIGCRLLLGIRSMSLATRDAHALYERFGFTALENPENSMQRTFEVPWLRPNPAAE